MKHTLLYAVVAFLLLLSIVKVSAQSNFTEGVIIYRIDTLRRTAIEPGNYIPTEVKISIKNKLLRIDYVKRNKVFSNDSQHFVEIRNNKGIYSYIKNGDANPRFALYTTYSEEAIEKRETALSKKNSFYSIEKIVKDTIWLNYPSRKVLLTGGNTSNEAVLSSTLTIPIQLFFFEFKNINTTPLRFIESDESWQFRVSATSIQEESLPDSFFEVDKSLMIVPVGETKK